MRTYRLARIVSVLLFLAAAIYFIGGFAFGIRLWSRGLGDGWGSGFAGWLSIPIFIGAFFGALTLLIFGAVLYFLTAINNNLAIVRQSDAFSAPKPEAKPVAPIAAPIVPPAPRVAPPEPVVAPPAIEPIARVTAPAAVVAPPQVEAPAPTVEAVAPQIEDAAPKITIAEQPTIVMEPPVAISPELLAELPEGDADAETAAPEAASRLPGAEQAARIASELAAAQGAPEA